MASGFSFNTGRFKSAEHMEQRLMRAIGGVAKYWDGPIEGYMKEQAPWTDRTTNARNGLKAQHVEVSPGRHWILMTHSVHYGVYLETKNDGRYAIIIPTLRVYGPKVMGTLIKILDRLDHVGGAT